MLVLKKKIEPFLRSVHDHFLLTFPHQHFFSLLSNAVPFLLALLEGVPGTVDGITSISNFHYPFMWKWQKTYLYNNNNLIKEFSFHGRWKYVNGWRMQSFFRTIKYFLTFHQRGLYLQKLIKEKYVTTVCTQTHIGFPLALFPWILCGLKTLILPIFWPIIRLQRY